MQWLNLVPSLRTKRRRKEILITVLRMHLKITNVSGFSPHVVFTVSLGGLSGDELSTPFYRRKSKGL